jgi:hypothetical protein
VTADHAALLAVGSAGQWQTALVERDVAPEDVESYIAAAKAHGIDPDNSFPFQIRGNVMHVNAAPIDGPHGMGLPRFAGSVGVATHGGERTHAHWVAPDLGSTAHLDRWGLKAGAALLLPK